VPAVLQMMRPALDVSVEATRWVGLSARVIPIILRFVEHVIARTGNQAATGTAGPCPPSCRKMISLKAVGQITTTALPVSPKEELAIGHETWGMRWTKLWRETMRNRWGRRVVFLGPDARRGVNARQCFALRRGW